jgi:hypothetical protein
LVAWYPGRGQSFVVTATGTTNPINSGAFSTVPGGTPFTFTLTYSLATTTVAAGTNYTGPGVTNYSDPSGTATASFDGLSFLGTAPNFQVFSNYFGLYGYQFTATGDTTNSRNFAIQLWSDNSSVAPDLSLNSIRTSDISNFSPSKSFALNTANGGIGGVITNFSVSEVAAPEPSTIYLLPIAFIFLAWQLYKRRVQSV